MVTITMNGKEIKAEKGKTILQCARENNIYIPTLCYDETLSIYGGCRLCVVEVEGARNLVASCTTEATEGMVIQTESEKVVEARKKVIDLLLSSHPVDCLTCEKAGNCDLQDVAYRYGVKKPSYIGEVVEYAVDDANPVIVRDPNKCILCGKCVRVCDEIQVTHAIDFVGRGFDATVGTPFNEPMSYEICRLCGQCVSVCPTGALTNRQFEGTRPWEVEKVTTTCSLCGVGCTYDLNVKDGRVVGVTPKPDSIVNGSSLCVKGRFHTDFAYSPDRITTPLIKKDGEFVEASWDEALDFIAEKLNKIKAEDGPDAIAGLSSARCTNEENYLFQKMMKAAIGTNNVDHCART
ncbi:MAG TPA: 2Fe-2S iron-sulfur cluster-binding protein [Clostridia bacterium]|nr:2Fe-2S iron-sulfur cluster-binding protein [Clostridia bacterium]